MKFINKLFLVLVVVGAILAIGGYHDASILLKDKTINLNEAQAPDLEEEVLIEGKVNFAMGPFATLEQSEKRYGITTNVQVTEFYIVANFDSATYMEWWNSDDEEDLDVFYVVVSATKGSSSNGLSMLAKRWEQFFEDYDRLMDTGSASEFGLPAIPIPPTMEVDIKGFLSTQPTDAEYIQYRNDYIEYEGIDGYTMPSLRIVNREIDKNTAYLLFFGGIGLAVLSIILFVATLIAARRRKRRLIDEANNLY